MNIKPHDPRGKNLGTLVRQKVDLVVPCLDSCGGCGTRYRRSDRVKRCDEAIVGVYLKSSIGESKVWISGSPLIKS